MNCDDFLPSLETGSPLRRWRAHRHAHRCPRCAAALAMLDQVKQALAPSSDKATLPSHLRRRWMAAAQADISSEPSPDRYRIGPQTTWLRRTTALAAIVLLVVAVAIGYKLYNGSLVLNDKVTVGPITVTQVDRAAELTRLDDEIVQLQAQVSSLINAAERLEAQQRIVLVLAQNITW